MEAKSNATREEVETFLSERTFSGYQGVPLPHGLRVPGKDLGFMVEELLNGIEGKSLLEVGTYYGYFPLMAMQRGAESACGVELDPQRFEIARDIAKLYGNTYDIIQGAADTIVLNKKYDMILFLNVLHHVTDPVSVMRNLASYCKGQIVVEFCLTSDIGHMTSTRPTRFKKIGLRIRRRLFQWVCAGLPVMAVGSRPYHRTFYFSKEAFDNLFVKHLALFKQVSFKSTPRHKDRIIAICEV